MEVILKKEQKKEVDDIIDFLNSLNIEEMKNFKVLINGYKLGRESREETVKN